MNSTKQNNNHNKLNNMRKLMIVLSTVLITVNVIAQVPEKMSYQALIRNGSNQLVINHVVGMLITILQDSVTGSTVYTETHTPTSDASGLVSIEIGGGDDFSSIDWANGPYFIKTETDPTGGTNYSITSTSQLLSVPFAFHAKNGITAEEKNKLATITGTNTGDQDLSGLAKTTDLNKGLASKVDKISGKGLSSEDFTTVEKYKLDYLTIYDGSETKIKAGTNMTVTGKGTTANPYVLNADNKHYAGELYAGGVIFYVDQTGQHGLVCSLIDLSNSQVWSNIISVEIGSVAKSDWNGQGNSNAIISQTGHTNSAAKLCLDYTNANYGTGVYSDWYLPSIGELNDLWNNLTIVQKALDNDGNDTTTKLLYSYWSSTEYRNIDIWKFEFWKGTILNESKSSKNNVRAVRTF
jgi:hypothetical protein